MRVVHVVRQFAPSVGGLEDMVLNLCREQRAAGCDARVVTLDRVFHRAAPRLPASDTVQGIPVARIRYLGSHRYPLAPAVLAHVEPADIVHVHAIDFFYDFLAWTRVIHRRPLVATTHGGFFHTSFAAGPKRVYFHTVTRLSSRFYDRVIACSELDAEKFRKIVGKKPLAVIENGVNVEKLADRAAPSHQRTIICFGRISSSKRIEKLFPVLRELNGVAPWRLIIAGWPHDVSLAALAAKARHDGVAGRVSFHDSPSDDELAGIVGRATYFASASCYEGFGIAAVEAMSAGLVPILSDIAPFRKLLRRRDAGIVVDFSRDPRELAAEIAALAGAVEAAFPRARQQLMRQARQAHGWTQAAQAYLSEYEKVIGGGREASATER